jgi:acyl-CoA thioester hydrolase
MADRFSHYSRIRFVDTDATRRIHYTALLRHFEAAEEEFMRSIGWPYADIERRDESYPRVHVEADYIGALNYDDEIDTQVSVARVGEKSYTLLFHVTTRGILAGKGKIVAACMDKRTQRSRPLPEAFAAALRLRIENAGTA